MSETTRPYVLPSGGTRWHIAVSYDQKKRTALTQCSRMIFVIATKDTAPTEHSDGSGQVCNQCRHNAGRKTP